MSDNGMSDNDSFTETTSTSWMSRLGDSLKGILLGFVMVIAATVLMYWNEGRAVRTGDAIIEAQQVTVPLPSIDKVDPSFDGKMVYTKGRATTTDVLIDPTFGIKVNAIKLSRHVEFYQWKEQSRTETKQNLGGGEEKVTTYSYAKSWSGQPVDSSTFKRPNGHENSVRIQTEDKEWLAPNVTFGAYRLPEFVVNSISGDKVITPNLTNDQRAELHNSFFDTEMEFDEQEEASRSNRRQRNRSTYSMVHNQGNMIYIGRSPDSPRIGDVRITFHQVPPADISLIARISGDTFTTFRASNGNTFSRVSMGFKDMDLMFADAQSDNETMTWILRVIGILLCIGGIKTILNPLRVLADVVPMLGSVVGMGLGLVAWLIGIVWSFIVIAIAWIRFRPLLGITLLVVAGALVAYLYMRNKKQRALAQQTSPAQTPPAPPQIPTNP